VKEEEDQDCFKKNSDLEESSSEKSQVDLFTQECSNQSSSGEDSLKDCPLSQPSPNSSFRLSKLEG